MGGTGGGIAYNKDEFIDIVERGIDASPTSEVLVEESVLGWKEFEMEVVRDKADNCIIVCSIENIDPMGVHTGDSITVAPALTLTDKEYQIMRDASLAVLREIGVETGGSNVQFAVNPADGRMIVIEMNPRVSRSSALASKATGFPIAKVAAKLAVGYTLDEIANDITGGATPASFEPTIDYIVTKIPRFAFEKFPGAEPVLTTAMKSVGEAMAIGRTFAESLQKALRSLETGLTGLDEIEIEGLGKGDDINAHARRARQADARPAADRRAGAALRHERRRNPRRLHDRSVVPRARSPRSSTLEAQGARAWPAGRRRQSAHAEGGGLFRCAARARSPASTRPRSRERAPRLASRRSIKRIDTCAAEFASPTAYMYSTYEAPFAGAPACEARPSEREKIVILGGGPNRIGQGIEFDYCCCHASFALRDAGFETIMINCNPETVSTDYDTSDRLYFEPLTAEDVLDILAKEQRDGHAQGRDRAVRRPDAAETRAAIKKPALRSSAPRSTRSISPRIATASSGCSTSSASSSRRTASPIRSNNRGSSPPNSACRWWCAPPMCSAGARWRSSTTRPRSTITCSACCRASCPPTSRRAIPTTRPARSTPCSARTRCCSTAISPTRSRSTSMRSATARRVRRRHHGAYRGGRHPFRRQRLLAAAALAVAETIAELEAADRASSRSRSTSAA